MSILKKSRHEVFARAVACGKTQKDAAIDAGYKVSNARKTGSELGTREDISSRVKELKELAAGDTVMTIQERMERLTELATEEIKHPVKAREAVQAVAELNKMTPGAYAPRQLEIEPGPKLSPVLEKLLKDIRDIEREEKTSK